MRGRSRTSAPWCALVATMCCACAPELVPEGAPDAGAVDAGPLDEGEIPPVSGPFRHEVGDDGVVTTSVDATATDGWSRLDLETGLAVETSDDPRWDLAFQRFYVTTNGGASGSGAGAAARLPGHAFDDVDRAPESGWVVDAVDGEEDEDSGPDTAFNGGPAGANDWYDYDPSTHRLTPRDVTFVVRSAQGSAYKVQLLAYYDEAGTPAVVRFRWAPIQGDVELPDAGPPSRPDAGAPIEHDAGGDPEIPSDAITIDASSRTAMVFVRVGAGVVDVADPATSEDWDLAFRRVLIQTSSGTSGPGVGGARSAGEVELASITETDTLGFAIDELVPSAMPGGAPSSGNPVLGAWFDYDVSTHAVTPKPIVWIVRTARGGYARMRIWSWDDGVYRVSLDPIEARPIVHTLEVDASARGVWAYVDLHHGRVVTPSDPATDTTWDLGLSRTLLRTSSGPSGPGVGGAIDTGAADAASVLAIPSEGWTPDDERVMPGPPGAPTYAGNGALEGWYDYDPTTHAITPRATTFLVRLADGSAGRLRIAGWNAGRFTLEWTCAGPRRSAL